MGVGRERRQRWSEGGALGGARQEGLLCGADEGARPQRSRALSAESQGRRHTNVARDRAGPGVVGSGRAGRGEWSPARPGSVGGAAAGGGVDLGSGRAPGVATGRSGPVGAPGPMLLISNF